MRRGFTLIELLVIIGIMGAMVTVSVINVRSGQGVARVRGATRDIFGTIRHARSLALVSQQPAIITYSCEVEDGEPKAKIAISGVKMLDTKRTEELQSLSGEPIEGVGVESGREGENKPRNTRKDAEGESGIVGAKSGMGEEGSGEEVGQAIEDVLFAPIDDRVVTGMRLKVVMEGEELEPSEDDSAKRRKISVFSNADFLLGKFADKQKKDEQEKSAKAEESAIDKETVGVADKERQEPISVVWETNGRVEPHRVWVYEDGSTPEKGLCIKIDRFGAAKVLSGDEMEDE